MYRCVYVYLCIWMYRCVCVPIWICVRVCVCIYIYIYIYTHIWRFGKFVIFPNTIFFRHTNELRNFSLTHNNESSLVAALNIRFAFGTARLVVFRLVGCLRQNGLAGCWDGSVLLEVWGMCLKSPCSFVSGIWRRVCVSPLMWPEVKW